MKFIFKLFGWLFSNILLILVVLGLSYAYVYWDDPFAADTPVGKLAAALPDELSGVRDFVTRLSGSTDSANADEQQAVRQDTPAQATQSAETVAVSAETVDTVPAQSPAPAPPQQGDSQQNPAQQDASPPADPAEVFGPAADFPDEGMMPAGGQAAASAQKALLGDVYVPPEIENALSQLHNDGSVEDVAVMQQADKPVEQLIIDARRAFYRRDYDASIAAYKQVIANDSENFDALGELGNVYFNQGKTALAAEAYYQAAMIMISRGKGQRAASLIGFLSSVDAEKAKKLGEALVADKP